MVGVKLIMSKAPVKPSLGVTTSDNGGKLIVTSVRSGSGAEKGGISVNDEILSIDGWRASSSFIRDIVSKKNIGDTVEIILSRDNVIKTYNVPLGAAWSSRYSYDFVMGDDQTKKNFVYWMRVHGK